MTTLVVVGAGPGGTSLLERLVANAPQLAGSAPIDVHVIDPHPPGAGRVWRHAQSPLLWMNSMAEDVTMFTDASVVCEGPIVPGPDLAEWAAAPDADGCGDPAVVAERAAVTGMTFPTRRLQSAYLDWVFRRVLEAAPPNVSMHVHESVVEDLTEDADGMQEVWLAGRSAPIRADAVVLALGHLDMAAANAHAEHAAFATRHGLFHLPPAYSADVDLSAVPAGADVIVRGFGLAFIDVMVLLTEGRGGRFVPEPSGRLRYEPSGSEPRLFVGSRRGVPYHAKIGYRLAADPPPLPRFLDAAAVDALIERALPVDFFADVWPRLAKDVAWGYYHELFHAHPARTSMSWHDFSARLAELDWGGGALDAVVTGAVPDPVDRLDVAGLDQPLRERQFAGGDDLQVWMRDYIAADRARRADRSFSADLGAFRALLLGYGQVVRLVGAGRFAARSQARDVTGWWHSFFSAFASGPPGPRLDQLLALSEAGLVRFVGAGMWVDTDDDDGVFRAGSASTPEVVEAHALVEARLPAVHLHRVRDRLITSLRDRGDIVENVLDAGGDHPIATGKISVTPELRVVDTAGRAHARRFAIGAPTSRPAAGTFARPRTNAPAFRQNDALARTLLGLLAAPTSGGERRVLADDGAGVTDGALGPPRH